MTSTTPSRSEFDVIERPAHYAASEIECIDALRACLTPEEFRGYCKGSAMAYLWRLGKKDAPEQEAGKANWYVSWLTGKDPRGVR